MANPRRASMREGPLAALFRKTEEAEDRKAGATRAAERRAPKPREQPPVPAHPRDTGLPHPALSASPSAPPEEHHVPSPQERLRHAFSSEIPDNLMDRPARTSAPEHRREPAYSPPAGVAPGGPIIRAVGVAGGGGNAFTRMV